MNRSAEAGKSFTVNGLGNSPAEAATRDGSSKFLGDYLHVCPRTDDLLDEYDQDFRHCRCFQPTDELLALQDAINVRLDAERG